MKSRATDSTNMEDLVRATPNVEPTRTKSFRKAKLAHLLASPQCRGRCATHGIDDGSGNVRESLSDEVPPPHLLVSLFNTERLRCVGHWEGSGPSDRAEQCGSCPSPFGRSKPWHGAEHSGSRHNRSDLRSCQLPNIMDSATQYSRPTNNQSNSRSHSKTHNTSPSTPCPLSAQKCHTDQA
jgi:hypothetical protein